MYCTNCGKEIESEAKFCPECGAAQQSAGESARNDFHKENQNSNEHQQTQNQNEIRQKTNAVEELDKLNAFCIVGFVISIISIFFIQDLFAIIGIGGFIFSLLGYRQAKERKEKGVIFGIVGIGISAVVAMIGIINFSAFYF